MARMLPESRILYVDAFDSFSNNIVGLLEKELNVRVTVIHIDDQQAARNIGEILKWFDAVIVGPGPGHPAHESNVGFINQLWQLDEHDLLPIFGICLGFQSLCLSGGASVERLRTPRHGLITRISHQGLDIWAGIDDCHATQYHSLCAVLDATEANRAPFWSPSKLCSELQPLAWDLSDAANGPILQSVRHIHKPFWGVQFHPESICTTSAGKDLVRNWWRSAQTWLATRKSPGTPLLEMRLDDTPRTCSPAIEPLDPADDYISRRALINANEQADHCGVDAADSPIEDLEGFGAPFVRAAGKLGNDTIAAQAPASDFACIEDVLHATMGQTDVILRWKALDASSIDGTAIVEMLQQENGELIFLDAQNHPSGRYSMIGLIGLDRSFNITYDTERREIRYGTDDRMSAVHVDSIEEVWQLLQHLTVSCRPRNGLHVGSTRTELPAESPFWGGFMGYVSYEAGLETIQVGPHASCADSTLPDLSFAFVSRSIVVDHHASRVYVQSVGPCPSENADWIESTCRAIATLARLDPSAQQSGKSLPPEKGQYLSAALTNTTVHRPNASRYREKILETQEFLRAGDSYELCLTDQTILRPDPCHPIPEWSLYKRLRKNNPAPFGAFMRWNDVLFVGSSPERFLSWTRDGHAQFRPIKGTVKKSADMTRARAHEILGSSKEQAENLMIVDLIRHDLSGVVGAQNTRVTKLMVVEEYEHVYQLVSVIEGDIPSHKSGIDVLKASLPPGSMTGAPKKRSCEILRDIEQRPRGLYSGVLGYLDIGGGGDFSVVIRSLIKAPGVGYWVNGAGGAVTIQSTAQGEYLEMEAKNSSVLGAIFKD